MKNLITLIVFIYLTACATQKSSIVGVWKPKAIILPDSIRKQSIGSLIKMTFEYSREINYQFNSDSTFGFISNKQIPGLENVNGKYSIDGKMIIIEYNNKIQASEIVKLTGRKMKARSKDGVIIIYEKVGK